MTEAVVVDVLRTASGRGKPGGALSATHPVDLLSAVLSALAERNGLDPALIDDVVAGCANQGGEQAANVGRNAALAAGFPESVPGTTIDRQCGSSQQAAHFVAQGVMAGAYEIAIACGVESMSRVPMGSPRGDKDAFGERMRRRYADGLVNQGVSAELIAARWKLDRQDLDSFAERSHRLATQAASRGDFDAEILPVPVTLPDGSSNLHRRDETVRTTDLQRLASLPPSFRDEAVAARFPEIQWNITAGNSSPLTDGASAALIMSEERAASLGLRPRARFHAFALAGDDPVMMLTAPIPATRKILQATGLSLDDIDTYEVNEAFASVPLAWARDLGADPAKLNPSGGAIALGHPLGASGVRLLTTMLSYLERTGGRYGLQTMCEGGGMANVMIIERL